jgi:hypothetical protein
LKKKCNIRIYKRISLINRNNQENINNSSERIPQIENNLESRNEDHNHHQRSGMMMNLNQLNEVNENNYFESNSQRNEKELKCSSAESNIILFL